MTKKIRIMNADTAQLPVRVRTQSRKPSGTWQDDGAFQLNTPADMNEQYIHTTRRVIIEEANAFDDKDLGMGSPCVVTEEMVNRFLAWTLPADFDPDGCLLSHEWLTMNNDQTGGSWMNTPTGTNLFSAEQARAMIAHILGVSTDAARMTSVRTELDPEVDRIAREQAEAMSAARIREEQAEISSQGADAFAFAAQLAGSLKQQKSTST